MADQPSPSINADKDGGALSSKYIPKFLVLIFFVIFYMIEEQAWYADDFHNPRIDISQIDNYNALSDHSFEAQSNTNRNTFSRNTLEHEKKNQSIKCREVTVKGILMDSLYSHYFALFINFLCYL